MLCSSLEQLFRHCYGLTGPIYGTHMWEFNSLRVLRHWIYYFRWIQFFFTDCACKLNRIAVNTREYSDIETTITNGRRWDIEVVIDGRIEVGLRCCENDVKDRRYKSRIEVEARGCELRCMIEVWKQGGA